MPSPFLATVWLERHWRPRCGDVATAAAVPNRDLGLGAGLLFAVGDFPTKLVAGDGIWLIAIVPLIVGYALGFARVLQNGFQQGNAFGTGAWPRS